MNNVAVHQNRSRALRASIAALGLTLAGLAFSQSDYRDRYPMVDTNSLNGLSINVNIADPSDEQLQQIADAGFKFIRHELTWDGIERSRGKFDWYATDRLINRARNHGIRVMALLAYSNSSYTSTGAPDTPESRAAFARFAAAAAARYKEQGVIWEIYNEPNLTAWWKNPSAENYAALVNATADAIRAVSPNEWIVGLTTEMLRPDNASYIDTVLSTPGVLDKLDGVGFHPYTRSAPETMAAQWASARALIEARRPANRNIALLAGEVGYLREWGITNEVQANYNVRLALFNLAQGIGFTNLYSYDDPSAGMTSTGSNQPYPAFNAIQSMMTELKGYRFSKRLDLGRGDDYCLLFVKETDASDCKIICWTTGAPHTMNVPSSAVNFMRTSLVQAQAATQNATKSADRFLSKLASTSTLVPATGAGLQVPATAAPVLYDSVGANPLLILAAGWAKLPASLTLANRSEAYAQLGSLVASPAWSGLPAGSTLKIEDVPTAVKGFVRPSFTTTLTNLSSLTVNSAPVQSLFNSLPSLQDELDAPRTLRLTVAFPGGGSVVQTATITRKQPMSVSAATPQSNFLSVKVDNPTGAAFIGSVKATAGSINETQTVRIAAGETFKMVYFTKAPAAPATGGVKFALYDAGRNVAVPSSPVVESTSQWIYRSPQFVASAGYRLSIGGPSNVSGQGSVAYGLADWSFLKGAATADISYRFGAGSKYAQFSAPAAFTNVTFDKVPLALGMWVKGDNSGNTVRALMLDASNQTFQVTGPMIDWTGWKWITIPVQGNFTAWWGGAGDGQVRGAMRVLAPFLLDSNHKGTAGTVSLFGISVIGQK